MRVLYTGRNQEGTTLVARWDSFHQAEVAIGIQNQRSPGWRVVGVKESFFEVEDVVQTQEGAAQ